MKYAKKIVLLAIAALLVLYLGYRIWFYKQYHIDMTFEGTLVLLDGTTIPMSLNVEGYISPAPSKNVISRGKTYKTEKIKLAFREFRDSVDPDFAFCTGKKEDYFTDYWDVPYIIGQTLMYDKQEGFTFYGSYGLSTEEGLILLYTHWHGPEERLQDELGYYFYGSVNGDYTLEEMQEYFAVFHRDFGN